MKYNLELLKADFLDELEKIKQLEAEFLKFEGKLIESEDKVFFYDRSTIGTTFTAFTMVANRFFVLSRGFLKMMLAHNHGILIYFDV